MQVLFKIFNTRFVKRKKTILLEITDYLLVGVALATLNMLFCFLSFSFFCERFQSLQWAQSDSCILLTIKGIPSDLICWIADFLSSKKIVWPLTSKSKKKYGLVYWSHGLLAEVVTFYSLDPRLRPQHLFKEYCLFDSEAYFKSSSFIFNLFKIFLFLSVKYVNPYRPNATYMRFSGLS